MMFINARVPSIVRALPLALVGVAALASGAQAQTIGTFRWQQQPYCNVITLNVVQQGAVYQVDGFDDQCDAGTHASAAGLAFLNPNGSIGFGLTVVVSPGGTPVHIDATIDLQSVSGTWRDSTGATGPWTFAPNGSTGGSQRPVPRAVFPAGLSAGNAAITNVASPVNATDAATKAYVDGGNGADRAFARALYATTVNVSGYAAKINSGQVGDVGSGCLRFGGGSSTQLILDLPLPVGALPGAVAVKYIDSSASAFTMDVRVYLFQEGASRQDNSAGSALSTNGAVDGNRLHTLAIAAPAPVTQARGYYLILSAPSYATGDMAFCGAQVTYSIP